MCLVLKIFTQLDRPIQPASRPACLSKFWKREREAKKEREIVPLYRLLPLGSKAISEFLKKGKSEKMQNAMFCARPYNYIQVFAESAMFYNI